MNIFKKLSFAVAALLFAGYAAAQEAPDVLIKRISEDVMALSLIHI